MNKISPALLLTLAIGLPVQPSFAQIEKPTVGAFVGVGPHPENVPIAVEEGNLESADPDTGPLVAALQERFRDRIAGIYIERDPDFHVVVRLTGNTDEGTLQYQLGDDRVRVKVEAGALHSLAQLRAAFERREIVTQFLPDGYGGYADEQAGELVFTVDLGNEAAIGNQAALADALGVPVRIVAEERAMVFPAQRQ